jgi:hypothetical protein
MRNNDKRYKEFRSDLMIMIGNGAAVTIDAFVQKVEAQAIKARSAKYDGVKIDAIDSLICEYCNGFTNLFKRYKLNGNDLDWAAENYHNFFDSGIDSSVNVYMNFGSHHPIVTGGGRYVLLEICSKLDIMDQPFQLYFDELAKGRAPHPPIRYNMTLSSYARNGTVRMHKKIGIEIKI